MENFEGNPGRRSIFITDPITLLPRFRENPTQATSDARRALLAAEAPRRPADDGYRGVLSITPTIKERAFTDFTPVLLRRMVGRLYNICTYIRNRQPSTGPECSEILRFLPPHPQNQISAGWNTQADVWSRNRRLYLLVARPFFVPQLRYFIVFRASVMKGHWYLAGVGCLVPRSFSNTRQTLEFYRNLNCR